MKRGNCYVTCEALYHLLGGKKTGWRPAYVKYKGDTHWFLAQWIPKYPFNPNESGADGHQGLILDPTYKQFRNLPPYHKGKFCGFLTKKPSKRAKLLMKQMLWQEER